MSKTSFILRPTSAKSSKRAVYVKHVCRATKSEFVRATGVEVEPEYFNAKTGKVSTKRTDAPELNTTLHQVFTDVSTAARNIVGWGGIPAREAMAKEYAAILQGRVATREAAPRLKKALDNRLDRLREQLVEAEATVTRLKERIKSWELARGLYKGVAFVALLEEYPQVALIAKGTKGTYGSVLADFKRFDSSLEVAALTPEKLREYENYLIGEGRNNVTIATYVGKVKTAYRYFAARHGLSPTALDAFKSQVKQLSNREVFHLSDEEVIALQGLQFTSPSEERVRDLFLLMCATGLRFSDTKITRANVVGKYLIVTTKKTNTLCKIPLSPLALEILQKYDYCPRNCGLNYFNRTIKRICERIPSMSDELAQTISLNGLAQRESVRRRCDAVSAHAGRKTFATRALGKGVSVATLKAWLGHSKSEMLLKHYANGEYNAVAEMAKMAL